MSHDSPNLDESRLFKEPHSKGIVTHPTITVQAELSVEVEINKALAPSPQLPHNVDQNGSIASCHQTPIRKQDEDKLGLSASSRTPATPDELDWALKRQFSPSPTWRLRHHKSFKVRPPSPSSARSSTETHSSGSSQPDGSSYRPSNHPDFQISNPCLEFEVEDELNVAPPANLGFNPNQGVGPEDHGTETVLAGNRIQQPPIAGCDDSILKEYNMDEANIEKSKLDLIGGPSQTHPLESPMLAAGSLSPSPLEGDETILDEDYAELEAGREDSEEPSQAPSFEEIELLSSFELDEQLRRLVRTPLLPKKVEKLEQGITGHVYIFKNHDRPKGHWKIGTTDGSPSKRAATLSNDCGVNITHQYSSLAMKAAKRAEELCHTHLGHFNKRYPCRKCKTKTLTPTTHREYFELKLGTAKAYVRLWSSFLSHVPYDKKGKLHDFWSKRLDTVPKPSHKEKPGDHQAQLDRWKTFITLNDEELNVWKLSQRVSISERLVNWYESIEVWRCMFLVHALIASHDLRGFHGIRADYWVWAMVQRAVSVVVVLGFWFYLSELKKTLKM